MDHHTTENESTEEPTSEGRAGCPGSRRLHERDGNAEGTDSSHSVRGSTLAATAVGLDTDDPTTDTKDLAPIGDALADRRIVSLGEATHGTREFFRLKHRFLRYLVEEHGYRRFAMEAYFAEALAIDRYVRDGVGTAEESLANIGFWTWNTEEVLAMIKWLREFNRHRPPGDRVRFYGIDAQFTGGSADTVRAYLERVDPAYLTAMHDDLETLVNPGLRAWPAIDQEEAVAAADRLLPALGAAFDERRAEYVDRSSESEWTLARRHVTVISQVVEIAEAVRNADDGGSDETLRIRDRAMASNTEWILEHESADGIVLWAHNDHVNRVSTSGNGHTATSLGARLAERHGDDYYALGFVFGRGGFRALKETDPGDENGKYELEDHTIDEPLRGTVAERFATIGELFGFFDVESVCGDPDARAWLDREQLFHSIGAIYDPAEPEAHIRSYVPSEAFDGLLYVDQTRPARAVTED